MAIGTIPFSATRVVRKSRHVKYPGVLPNNGKAALSEGYSHMTMAMEKDSLHTKTLVLKLFVLKLCHRVQAPLLLNVPLY